MSKGEKKRALRGRAGRMKGGRGSGNASSGQVRLWGRHAVEAALKNPDRQHRKLWATPEGLESLDGELPPGFPIEHAQAADLARLVAKDAPHQGLVLECAGLEDVFLDEVALGEAEHPIVVLDQVTDPHNVGAILRSAAAFGAAAIVTQDRHAPTEGGVLAKAASGALETVPWVRVVNLARALDELAEAGYWRIGLAGEADAVLGDVMPTGPLVIVLGAEGEGLDLAVAAACSRKVGIPGSGRVESLNVASATAVLLAEWCRQRR